ncbi:MAG TPA: hypothetical protein DEP05_08535 [Betaproteobacteria bacterium]|nr:hypothetical protein [Betaproteobacteria bacterium]
MPRIGLIALPLAPGDSSRDAGGGVRFGASKTANTRIESMTPENRTGHAAQTMDSPSNNANRQ